MQRTNCENNLPPPYLYIDPLDTFPYYSRTIPVQFPCYSRTIPVLFPYNKAANKQTLSHLYAKPKTTKGRQPACRLPAPNWIWLLMEYDGKNTISCAQKGYAYAH